MVTGISDREVTVYDIEVKGTNNFFADQILVHNCLIDDPIKDAQDAYSLVIRQQVIEFYRSVAYPRLMPGGRMVIILTRWHSGDLAGWLLDPQEQEKVEDWKLLVLPAIAECDEGWRKEGEALWPEKFSLSDLERIKRVKGDWDWAAQYQQRPSAIEGREIKRAWWKYYEWNPHMAADRSITRVLTQPYHIYQSWDTASKTDQQHDYSVCTTWLESGGNQYLLHMWRKKVIAPDLFQAAKDLALYWQAEAILVEDSAPAHAFVQMLQSQTKLPIIPITPKGDKAARARGVSPIIQAGRVFLPACQTSWLKDFLDEVSGFPVAAHDDALDSCTQYLSWQCIERDREESWAHTETADSPIDLFDI
jgi:predicted phage terminase large subunit-like protein